MSQSPRFDPHHPAPSDPIAPAVGRPNLSGSVSSAHPPPTLVTPNRSRPAQRWPPGPQFRAGTRGTAGPLQTALPSPPSPTLPHHPTTTSLTIALAALNGGGRARTSAPGRADLPPLYRPAPLTKTHQRSRPGRQCHLQGQGTAAPLRHGPPPVHPVAPPPSLGSACLLRSGCTFRALVPLRSTNAPDRSPWLHCAPRPYAPVPSALRTAIPPRLAQPPCS